MGKRTSSTIGRSEALVRLDGIETAVLARIAGAGRRLLTHVPDEHKAAARRVLLDLVEQCQHDARQIRGYLSRPKGIIETCDKNLFA